MGAVLLSPIYILLNTMLVWTALYWLMSWSPVFRLLPFVILFSSICLFLALTPLLSVIFQGRLQKKIKQINNCWLGILIYPLSIVVIHHFIYCLYSLICYHTLWQTPDLQYTRITGLLLLCFCGTAVIYGFLHANKIHITSCHVHITKHCPASELKIALIADLHLGHNAGLNHVMKIKQLVDTIHPDLIVFAGDIFDNDFSAISCPDQIARILRSMESTYGTYACWGNHDVEEKILAGFTFPSKEKSPSCDARMRSFLNESNIHILEDESVCINNMLYLSGRLDASSEKKTGNKRQSPCQLLSPLPADLPKIVIDHQPSQLQELADAGADLVLSGHTHDGQIFPINLITRMTWFNSRGIKRIRQMTSIVTSGVGTWGPAMRVGTCNEVMEITVHFQNTGSVFH